MSEEDKKAMEPATMTNNPSTAQQALALENASICPNPGNPVFSCVGKVEEVPSAFERESFYKPHHPLYQTSSHAHGELPATPASVPSTFHAKSQKFSQHLGVCGMYRNHSLNTALHKSKVYDPPRM